MKVVALLSGGKDSTFNLLYCFAEGHEIVAIANLHPLAEKGKDEVDSYMYQSVGAEAITFLAEALSLPCYRRAIHGEPINVGKVYEGATTGDEVEDLYELLRTVQSNHPDIEAVASGAIFSDYQRVRVEQVCHRLGFSSLAYLWRLDQKQLLQDMVATDLNAILIKIASFGLNRRAHLGRSILHLCHTLIAMAEDPRYGGLNPCGEGGEYESFTLDAPCFHATLEVGCFQEVVLQDAGLEDASVVMLKLKDISLKQKPREKVLTTSAALLSHYPGLKRHRIPADSIHALKLLNEEVSSFRASRPSTPASDLRVSKQQIIPLEWHVVKVEVQRRTNECFYEMAQSGLTRLREELDKKYNLQLSSPEVSFVVLLLSDMSAFGEVNCAYSQFFPSHHPPPRLCVAPSGAHFQTTLSLSLQVVILPRDTWERSECLHVRSLSYWAPANIGPYSQSLTYHRQVASNHCNHEEEENVIDESNICFLSGQISLKPEDSSVAFQGDCLAQTALVMRHALRIMKVLTTSQWNWSHLFMATCYFSRSDISHSDGEGDKELAQSVSDFIHAHLCLPLECCRCREMVFVWVDSLPKGALVEWQLIWGQGLTRPAFLEDVSQAFVRKPLITFMTREYSDMSDSVHEAIVLPVDQIVWRGKCYLQLSVCSENK